MRPQPTPAGYLVVRGPASLRPTDAGWLLVPSTVVEPVGSGNAVDALRVLRRTSRATDRYLERRGLRRPKVQWDRFP
ncbi:hypothetical protein [Streptomyces virginiae]|uniref:hypothetical protein n=1 Tax=Streptomyces virginiae TaxID=1961 RepID=UPI0037BC3CF8